MSVVEVDFSGEKARREHVTFAPTLPKAGGGGTSGGMEERVTRLETHMEYVRSDLAEIKASLGTIAGSFDGLKQDIRDAKLASQEARLEAIATKSHSAGKVTVITTGIAVVAIVLAVMAYGGDRFDGGLNASAIAERAVAAAAEKR